MMMMIGGSKNRCTSFSYSIYYILSSSPPLSCGHHAAWLDNNSTVESLLLLVTLLPAQEKVERACKEGGKTIVQNEKTGMTIIY